MSTATKPNIAMIGLGVMGANLARNIESRGYPVAVYNRSKDGRDEFQEKFGKGNFVMTDTLEGLVSSMQAPRMIFMMVSAGAAVDSIIDQLLPILDKGDILIDGGNTFFKDTEVREKKCQAAGINFLGVGISGGEEGALKGASIMPGGPKEGWKLIAPVLEKIAADADGPCTAYIGPGGAGHFVKMVHNGIEYGDMQLIAEAYQLLRELLGMTPVELGATFDAWNQGVLSSFLIEITGKIFRKKDDKGSDGFLVDMILDKAGQKGTGKWTSQVALDLGVPIPTLAAAVDARGLSSLKSERIIANKELASERSAPFTVPQNKDVLVKLIHDALYASKIMAYAQGMRMIKEASDQFKWDLNLSEIAALWKGGCIIRAKFLDSIRKAYGDNPQLANLILDPTLKKELLSRIEALRQVVSLAMQVGIPVPAFASSLSYFDAYRTTSLPQNLTQAQRDFFGAHTFERIDLPGSFHAIWE